MESASGRSTTVTSWRAPPASRSPARYPLRGDEVKVVVSGNVDGTRNHLFLGILRVIASKESFCQTAENNRTLPGQPFAPLAGKS